MFIVQTSYNFECKWRTEIWMKLSHGDRVLLHFVTEHKNWEKGFFYELKFSRVSFEMQRPQYRRDFCKFILSHEILYFCLAKAPAKSQKSLLRLATKRSISNPSLWQNSPPPSKSIQNIEVCTLPGLAAGFSSPIGEIPGWLARSVAQLCFRHLFLSPATQLFADWCLLL